MKAARTLVATAVAIVAVLALAVPSASALVIRDEGNAAYTGGVAIDLQSASAVFEGDDDSTITCEVVDGDATIDDSGVGDGVPNGTITRIEFENPDDEPCTDDILFGTVEASQALNLDWSFTVEGTSMAPTLNITDDETNQFVGAELELSTLLGTVFCRFGSLELVADVTNGSPTTLTLNDVLDQQAGSGGLCPDTSTVTATLGITASPSGDDLHVAGS
jgi:hypothetical protein